MCFCLCMCHSHRWMLLQTPPSSPWNRPFISPPTGRAYLGSQREMFPITSNIWATSGEPIPGQGVAFLEKTHHLFDSFYSPIFSLILLLFLAPNPNAHWAPCSKPPIRPWSLTGLVFPVHGPGECKPRQPTRPLLTPGLNLAQFPDQQAASFKLKEC